MNDEYISRVDVVLFRVITLYERAEHTLRGLCGAEVAEIFGIILLYEVYPARRAARNHRERSAVLNSVDKLGTLLHNGNVRREVYIEDLIEAEHFESRNHLTFDVCSDGITEFFAETYSDCGRGSHDDVFARVCYCSRDFVYIVFFAERAGRAYGYTLSAGNARSVVKGHFERACYGGIEASVVWADNGYLLAVLTDRYASAAENTLAVIPDEVRSNVLLVVIFRTFESVFVAAEFLRESLKFAVCASYTAVAGVIMVAEHKLDGGFSCVEDSRGICEDFGTVSFDGVNAGGYERSCALDFAYAHAARTYLVYVFKVAQRGNTNAVLTASVQNSGAVFHGIIRSVYFDIN